MNKNKLLDPEDLEGQTVLDLKPKKKRQAKKKPALTSEEINARLEALDTTRKKPTATPRGVVRNKRIDLAVTPSNFEYIQELAGNTKKTYSKLLNAMIAFYKAEHGLTVEENKELLKFIDTHYVYGANAFGAYPDNKIFRERETD